MTHDRLTFSVVVIFLGILVLAHPLRAPAQDEHACRVQRDELRQIKQRLIDEWSLRRVPDSSAIREQIERLDVAVDGLLDAEGGYWSAWKDVADPMISLHAGAFSRPRELARAYASPASRHHRSPRVLAAIEGSLRHLLKFAYPGCPQPGNWWAWQIGVAMHLTPTLILLEGQLDRELFDREVRTLIYLLKVEEDAGLDGPCPTQQPGPPGETDMNTLWHRTLRLQLAVLLENPAMAGKWARQACAEIGPPDHGALQADYSYKFHGQNPMWAYGRAFIADYALLAARYGGTSFGPLPAELDRYAAMLEHFVNGFLYRGRLCPAIVGREISRGPTMYENPTALMALAVMTRSDHPDAEQFARLYARERTAMPDSGDKSGPWLAYRQHVPAARPAPPVSDSFAYPDSDFLQVIRPQWAVGIKMHSSRNAGYESINGENLQGWFLSHGSTFHFIRGDEWDGCWPTLDWTRLPGTTVAADVKGQNASPFVGVLRGSDRVALAAMELKREGFTARKSWLLDGDAIVCLGSGIAGPGRVETTVLNQPVKPETELLIDGQPAEPGPFERTMTVRSIWLENMGYAFPDGQRVTILRGPRTSDWSSIRDPKRYGPTPPETHHYVTVLISHDKDSTDYRYIMALNVGRDVWTQQAGQIARRYELSTQAAHVIRTDDKRIESIVFWQAGQAGNVTADSGCMLLRSDNGWQAVDPARSDRALQVNLGDEAFQLALQGGRSMPLR
jgi:hypothetical protein